LNQINASSAGVNASYDYGAGKFVLTNKTTGDVGIFVSNDTGGLATAMGLVGRPLTPGSDAQFTINGGSPLTSRSNVLDDTAHGITGLSITATTENDPQTVTIASDSEATKSSLNDFISKYNAVQAAIEKYTKVDVNGDKVSAAILAGNRELADISRSMRRLLYEDNAALKGDVKRL
jgi:flagellar hook-associated protein 2